MKLVIITFGLWFWIACAYAQTDLNQCGTEMPMSDWEDAFQDLIQDADMPALNRSGVYEIPVIFHIVHSGEAVGLFPNISIEQIQSQITIINQDFSAAAYNLADYPDNAFVNWAANVNLAPSNLDELGRVKIADIAIQFCPALISPDGQILNEPGIDRINYLDKGWPNPTQFGTQSGMKNYLDSIVKPQSIWDVTKYLNVWVTDKSDLLTYAGVSSVPPLSGLLGIPNTATDTTDGIWCYAKAIGAYALFPSGYYISSIIDGRTLTHELGHYFGLRHIWGDAVCGNDFCNDTPPAGGQNVGLPEYPHNAGSCSLPSVNVDGEMFMNFMDYTAGPGKYMFTTDQKTRIYTAMQNSPFRSLLGMHNLCSTSTSTYNLSHTVNKITIYPNPATDNIYISVPDERIRQIRITDLIGTTVKVLHTRSCSISDLISGNYIVYIETNTQLHILRFSKL